MANQKLQTVQGLLETYVDMGDGTFARREASVGVNPDGSTQTALPPGRAAATASVPTVLSNEDKASLDLISTSLTPNAAPALTGSLVAKASPGKLYGMNVVSGASAGYVMIIDSATVPADGAVTPKKVFALAANSSTERSWDRGLIFTTGIVIVFSTTGPYSKTLSATAFIEAETI